MPGRGTSCTLHQSFVLQPYILSITVLVRGRFGHQRATGVASFVQKYGAEQDMGRGEIIVPAGPRGAGVSPQPALGTGAGESRGHGPGGRVTRV